MVCVRKQIQLASLAILVIASCTFAIAQDGDGEMRPAHPLTELRSKHRALLVVFRSRVLDVSNRERAIIEDVLKADPQPKGRNRWVYTQIAGKLNQYIRKYRSLSAADALADADYVIYFNVVEYRKILDTVYPYGELFVIVKGAPEQLKPPRVVWRANKVLFAGDAIGDLIKELKAIHGES
ncbi:MAG TPA: hypothetical protein VGJ37_09230 [Pyrinomonadaceae bacterium]|jgi:hypothetical protein